MRSIPRRAALLVICSIVIATTAAARGSTRIVVRNVTLLALDEPDAPARPEMTLLIEGGVITAIQPASVEVALRAGDVPLDGGGAFVLPGLVELVASDPPTYAELARRPYRGVLEVIAPCTESDVRRRRRIAEHAPFKAAELLCGAVDGAASSRVPDAGAIGAPSTRGERARWILAHTREPAAAAGFPGRATLGVGSPANLLLLRTDPLEDLAAFERVEQAVIEGRTIRRAELETNLDFIREAERVLAEQPAPDEDRRSYFIETSGLRLGRLDVAADGSSAREFLGPPLRRTLEWRLRPAGRGWSLEGRLAIGALTRLAFDVLADPERVIVRGRLDEPDARPSETTLEAVAQEPFFDPVSLLLRRRAAVVELAPGEALSFEAIELHAVDQALQIGLRTLRLRRVDGEGPWDPRSDRMQLRLESEEGRALSWILIDAAGRPLAAISESPAGVTEYIFHGSESHPEERLTP